LVLISGLAPIRANKLRYYEDENFTERVLPAPALNDGDYADKPETRPDDWGKQVRKADTRLAAQDDAKSTSTDEGGMQQQRHPGLGEEIVKTAEPEQGELPNLLDDDSDSTADKNMIDRAATPARAYGVNEAMGPDRDLLDGF
jgi:type IV secretion system protein VirD4